VGLKTGLDWCGKSHPTGIRSPERPARRQSLYRLRYPAHPKHNYILFIMFTNTKAQLRVSALNVGHLQVVQ